MASIRIESLVKRFGTMAAVDGVDIEIADKEFLAIVGPSGCGKSSTLRMLSGLEAPTSGHILFGDDDVTQLPADKRDVAMVFQSYALYPHMSVRRNLAFPLENMRLPRSEIEARVAKAAEMLGITSLLERRPRELSGGQRQRVALGRAVVRNAAVFLFDEPLSNLDAKLRVVMRSELKKLHGELGQTFVYVTHDQAEAMTMADRIAVMANGKLQQVGTPDEIYFEPANRFVAEFMGTPTMNVLEGEIVKSPTQAKFQIAGSVEIPLPDAANALAKGQKVVLGVRPESVSVAAPGETGVEARVVLVEPLHPDIFVTVSVGGQSLLLRTDTAHRLRPGDAIHISIPPTAIHLFDSTGQRVNPAVSGAIAAE